MWGLWGRTPSQPLPVAINSKYVHGNTASDRYSSVSTASVRCSPSRCSTIEQTIASLLATVTLGPDAVVRHVVGDDRVALGQAEGRDAEIREDAVEHLGDEETGR